MVALRRRLIGGGSEEEVGGRSEEEDGGSDEDGSDIFGTWKCIQTFKNTLNIKNTSYEGANGGP